MSRTVTVELSHREARALIASSELVLQEFGWREVDATAARLGVSVLPIEAALLKLETALVCERAPL